MITLLDIERYTFRDY